jgi:hypothetical protein
MTALQSTPGVRTESRRTAVIVAPIATQLPRLVRSCKRVSLAWLVCLPFAGAVAANPIELTVMTRNVYFGASLALVLRSRD